MNERMEMVADPREPEERCVLRIVVGSLLRQVVAGNLDAADAARQILMEPFGEIMDSVDITVAAARSKYANRPDAPAHKRSSR